MKNKKACIQIKCWVGRACLPIVTSDQLVDPKSQCDENLFVLGHCSSWATTKTVVCPSCFNQSSHLSTVKPHPTHHCPSQT